jgi:hypothetical protein
MTGAEPKINFSRHPAHPIRDIADVENSITEIEVTHSDNLIVILNKPLRRAFGKIFLVMNQCVHSPACF